MVSPAVALALFALGSATVAAVAWPRTGLAARAARRRLRRSDAVLAEDVLKRLFHQPTVALAELARGLEVPEGRVSRAVAGLHASGLVSPGPEGFLLTDGGRARALELVRAHRLWERYLADRTGVAEVEWHEEAEREEHRLTRAEAERLAARMGRPLVDPHGDPIPDQGEVAVMDGVPLATLRVGETAEIVHLEDEPTTPYRRLVEAGLAPGEHVTVIGRETGGVRLEWSGTSTILDPDEIEAVTVRRAPGGPQGRRLSSLRVGESARVIALAPALHGPQRRRLVDLGFVPGTNVEAELSSASGDPIAYRVRGALIALRRDQANLIVVEAA